MCMPVIVLENSESDHDDYQNSKSHFGSMDLKIEGFKEISSLESINEPQCFKLKENVPAINLSPAPIPSPRRVINLKEIKISKEHKVHKNQTNNKPIPQCNSGLGSPIKVWGNLVKKESSSKIHWETSKTERYYIFQKKK